MFRSFYNANKVDYLSLPSFKSGKGPRRSLKGEVQIAIDVKLKFRFICLQIDTVMLPKMEFPWNLRFPVTIINNLYTWEKKNEILCTNLSKNYKLSFIVQNLTK